MKIAIVGAGISGLTCAHYLSRQHRVTLFEANARIGGHTDTHRLTVDGQDYAIDSGFIVFNETNYPLFCRLLGELNVASQATEMSFGALDVASGVEYNATDINRLFCQRRNLLRPRFWKMVTDILRFYRESPRLLDNLDDLTTTADYLRENRYSEAFVRWHLIPMASALWSAPPEQIGQFPMRYMVQFFANHRMLQVDDRPEWRVIQGGSSTYVDALLGKLEASVRAATPVRRVQTSGSQWQVLTDENEETFDRVIFACHSDQALAMINQPTAAEADVLGAIKYQDNEVVVHDDPNVMPRNRKAWAAWNAYIPPDQTDACTVTYCMNILQGLPKAPDFLVTLNQTDQIQSDRIYARRRYAHPVYSPESVAAQARHAEIDGQRGLHFCGAYWGWGFHEDGVRSAHRVVDSLASSRDRAA